MMGDECGAVGKMKIGKGNESTSRKYTQMPLCSPQIPHILIPARTWAAALGNQRLTLRAMARMVTFTAELYGREAAHLYFLGARSLLTL
jgi:hypothetical protein